MRKMGGLGVKKIVRVMAGIVVYDGKTHSYFMVIDTEGPSWIYGWDGG